MRCRIQCRVNVYLPLCGDLGLASYADLCSIGLNLALQIIDKSGRDVRISYPIESP